MALEGEYAYELAIHSYSLTHEEGKVKSYQGLQTWNDNHFRKIGRANSKTKNIFASSIWDLGF